MQALTDAIAERRVLDAGPWTMEWRGGYNLCPQLNFVKRRFTYVVDWDAISAALSKANLAVINTWVLHRYSMGLTAPQLYHISGYTGLTAAGVARLKELGLDVRNIVLTRPTNVDLTKLLLFLGTFPAAHVSFLAVQSELCVVCCSPLLHTAALSAQRYRFNAPNAHINIPPPHLQCAHSFLLCARLAMCCACTDATVSSSQYTHIVRASINSYLHLTMVDLWR
jgi:hypothetical protein